MVHALAHAMNDALGNIGRTVTYHEPVEAHEQEALASLKQLVNDMNDGGVDVLLILGPTFFAGFRTLLPETHFEPFTFLALWLAVMGLMGLMVILAPVDVRLTWKLRQKQLARAAGGGDA